MADRAKIDSLLFDDEAGDGTESDVDDAVLLLFYLTSYMQEPLGLISLPQQ